MPATQKNKPLKRVLVTRFSAIGDVAMTIPVLYDVCRANPATEFVMLTRPAMAAMMVCPPPNLTVHPADVSSDYKGIGGMMRLLREVEAAHGPVDAMADLHNVLRTLIIGARLKLRGIPVKRIDKSRSSRRALTRRRGKVMRPLTPQPRRYAEVFEALGLATSGRPFTSVFGSAKGSPEAFAAVTPPKRPGERWIGIAPFARHQGKIYPPERMRMVVDMLAERPDTRLFLFGGGEKERAILGSWTRPNVISLAEKRLGFAVELSLLSHLDVMVSMDSANMHLASLAGVPVVSVWGATHPFCGFMGYGQSADNAVQLSLPCRPCSIFGNKPCHRGDYHCMAGIAPETIAGRVTQLIDS